MASRGQLKKKNLWHSTDTSGGTPVPPPVITSSSSRSVNENAVLVHTLTANESVTWSLVGGVDQGDFEVSGSTLRWLSNGTKDFEAPSDADLNNTYVVTVRASNGVTGLHSDQTVTVTVIDVIEGGLTLAPSANWTGVEDSGFGAPFEEIPAASDNANEMPSLHLLHVAYTTFNGDKVLCFTSNCSTANRDDQAGETFKDGVAGVDVYWEGSKVTITDRSSYTDIDPDGDPFTVYGYICILDGATAAAAHNDGKANLYAVARPTDPAKFPQRIGPLPFYPRTETPSTYWPYMVFDHTLHVDSTLADIVGVRYSNIQKALGYINAQGWRNTEVIADNTFVNVWSTPTGSRAVTDNWTVVRAAPGQTCTIRGSGSGSMTVNHNCICFGPGIILDYSQGNFTVSTNGRFWTNAMEINPSTSLFQNTKYTNPGFWISPVSATSYHIYTHDKWPDGARGTSNAHLVLNPKMDHVGEAFNNARCIHGGTIKLMDPFPYRVHAGNEAMTVTSPSGWRMAVSLGPNATLVRTVTIKDAGGVVQGTWDISTTVGSGHHTWEDLATWLNSTFSPNVNATVLPPPTPGHGSDLRVKSISNTTIVSNITTSPFTEVTIPTAASGGLTCTALIDVHLDPVQNFGAGPGVNNVDYGFLTIDGTISTQQIFLEGITGGQKNFFIHHMFVRSTTGAAGDACYWNGTLANCGMEFMTFQNTPAHWSTGTGFSPSCWMHHNYYGAGNTWVGGVDADLKNGTNYVRVGSTPTGATNTVNGANAAESTLFQDDTTPVGEPPLPILSGPLLISGNYVGCMLPDGSRNFAT